jgi:hypothetical protein
MATRFYLPSSGASAINPAYSAYWNGTQQSGAADGFARYALVTTKIGSSMATISEDGNTDTTDSAYIYGQWVSAPIAAQTISAQTLKLQIRALEENARANQFVAISVRVLSNDGTTVRGTILQDKDGTEIATSLTNRGHSATTTEVTASANDRIVIEIGTSGNPDTGSGGDSHDCDMRIGDASGSDLPENDTGTDDYNPWVEFANNITLASPIMETSTLVDDFNDNSINTSKWDEYEGNATVAETNQQLEITLYSGAGSNYAGIISDATYNLTGSYIYIELKELPASGGNAEAFFQTYIDANNKIFWYSAWGWLYAHYKVGGDLTWYGEIAYNPSTTKWLRIREASGTTYWDYSADGISWTNLTSMANPIAVTGLKVEISAGTWEMEASPGYFKVDNLNTTGLTFLPVGRKTLLGVGS